MSSSDEAPAFAQPKRQARCPQVGESRGCTRAREKLSRQGERSLSNSELLAVVLCAGSRKESAMAVAEKILRKYGFEALPSLDLSEWGSNRGIGPVKACRLRAMFEIGRRSFVPKEDERPALSSPRQAYEQVK